MVVEDGGVCRRDSGGGGGTYLIAQAGAGVAGPNYESEPPGLGFVCAVGNGGGR
jgi:hypothetical protein